MHVDSDSHGQRVDETSPSEWAAPPDRAPLLQRAEVQPTGVSDRRGLMIGAGTFGALVVSLCALSVILSRPFAAGAAPAWSVEITAAGDRQVMALIYGKEAGLHLVRVPAASAGRAVAPVVIPARLAEGELHMVSLGWSGLMARASSPAGTTPVAWMAEGRIITGFQGPRGTGVRTSW